jgi:hypothetical protein
MKHLVFCWMAIGSSSLKHINYKPKNLSTPLGNGYLQELFNDLKGIPLT